MVLSIIKLIIASLIPVLASILFYQLQKKTSFGKTAYLFQQIIIGIAFGGIAVMGTEWGIKMNGVVINCRDAAPMAAGFLFGGPAGIIAGLIGGIERWVAVAWGVGSYTRLACSVSTGLAGIYAAVLRKLLFENKKPNWVMALGCGIVMETFHLYMVFLTNFNDATKAIIVVNSCFTPMVIANGLSVMASTIAVSHIAGEISLLRKNHDEKKPIFETIQRWLFTVVAICFVITMGITFGLQNNMYKNSIKNTLEETIAEVTQDITDTSNSNMLNITHLIAREISYGDYDLNALAQKYKLTDISIINKDGIIVESNNPTYINFDMASGEQSAEFLCLNEGVEEYVQAYGPISNDAFIYRKFAGVSIADGFVQISYNADAFQEQIQQEIRNIASNRHIGHVGGVLITNEKGQIVSHSQKIDLDSFTQLLNKELNENMFGIILEETIDDNLYFTELAKCEGYYITAIYAEKDAAESRDISVYLSLFNIIIVFFALFAIIYMLIKHIVVDEIIKMTESLSNISSGNLDEVVDVRSTKEFSSLSDDINSTVNTLKHYIEEAAARIDAELAFAKSIQESALPSTFPAFPNRNDLDIYASMRTAKEVGGDFYDFYFSDTNQVNFLIADVSGKGIPAAMFMMRSKSVLKGLTESGLAVNEVFTNGNNDLCEGNDAGMFVTAWQASVNLSTGLMTFSNAGHNPPLIKHKDGRFEYYKHKANLVLAGMAGVKYRLHELQLEPGDIIYLYTDGVTEATNKEIVLYGEDRLLNTLNKLTYNSLKDICDGVLADIDEFVGDADQFDDITMLAFQYRPDKKQF